MRRRWKRWFCLYSTAVNTKTAYSCRPLRTAAQALVELLVLVSVVLDVLLVDVAVPAHDPARSGNEVK